MFIGPSPCVISLISEAFQPVLSGQRDRQHQLHRLIAASHAIESHRLCACGDDAGVSAFEVACPYVAERAILECGAETDMLGMNDRTPSHGMSSVRLARFALPPHVSISEYVSIAVLSFSCKSACHEYNSLDIDLPVGKE